MSAVYFLLWYASLIVFLLVGYVSLCVFFNLSVCLHSVCLSVYQSVRPSVFLLLSLCQFFHCGLSLHSDSSGSRSENSRKKNYLPNRYYLSPRYHRVLFIQRSYSCFLVTIFPPIAWLHFQHINPHTTHNSSTLHFFLCLSVLLFFLVVFFLSLAAW